MSMLDLALTEEWLRTASVRAMRRALSNPARFQASVLPRLRLRGVAPGTVVAPRVVWVDKEPFSVRFN